MKNWLLSLAFLMTTGWGCAASASEAAAVIHAIVFEGNERTREETLRREMLVREGDLADAEKIERSRQAIQDLGLFRKVELLQESSEQGLRLTFRVEEKWYFLAYPRLSANSDGQNSYGAEIRLNNLWGRNHTLRLLGRSKDSKDRERGGRQISYRGGYYAPLIFGTDFGLNLSHAHFVTPYVDPAVYDEILDETQLLLSRRMSRTGPASQGWVLSGGLLRREQIRDGVDAPPSFGTAYAAVGQLDFRNIRELIYSETGSRFSARYEVGSDDLLSDYSFTRLSGDYVYAHALGERPHQTLEYRFKTGAANNGPPEQQKFSLGGSEGLRGYERQSFEGNFFYLASAHWLRPVFRDSLRLIFGLEAGNAHQHGHIADYPQLSCNLGLRIRFTRFVSFEAELGFAYPLNGGKLRFYGERSEF